MRLSRLPCPVFVLVIHGGTHNVAAHNDVRVGVCIHGSQVGNILMEHAGVAGEAGLPSVTTRVLEEEKRKLPYVNTYICHTWHR